MKLSQFSASLLTLILAAGCAGVPAASPATTEIIFLADPPEIQSGECSLLVWDALGGR